MHIAPSTVVLTVKSALLLYSKLCILNEQYSQVLHHCLAHDLPCTHQFPAQITSLQEACSKKPEASQTACKSISHAAICPATSVSCCVPPLVCYKYIKRRPALSLKRTCKVRAMRPPRAKPACHMQCEL